MFNPRLNPQIKSARFWRLMLASILQLGTVGLWGATGGSISGTIRDQSCAVVPDATLELVNTGQHSTYHVKSDRQGLYSFLNLAVGHYDLTITAPGFTTPQKWISQGDDPQAERFRCEYIRLIGAS